MKVPEGFKLRLGDKDDYTHTVEEAKNYNESVYIPAMKNYNELLSDDAALARQCVRQHKALQTAWPKVSVSQPETSTSISQSHVGDSFDVTTRVSLASLHPQDVDVEIYYGPLNPHGEVTESHVHPMELLRTEPDGTHVYGTTVVCHRAGRFGCTARVTPKGNEWNGIMPGYICWAEAEA